MEFISSNILQKLYEPQPKNLLYKASSSQKLFEIESRDLANTYLLKFVESIGNIREFEMKDDKLARKDGLILVLF